MNPSWIHLAAGSRPARGLPEQTDRQARLYHFGGLFPTPLYHLCGLFPMPLYPLGGLFPTPLYRLGGLFPTPLYRLHPCRRASMQACP